MSGTIQGAASGSLTISGGGAGVFPVSFGYYPPEGSRCVTAQYNFASQLGFAEDLSQLVARGIETSIQSVYIDNTANSQTVTFYVLGTGHVVQCAAGGQGSFPLFFTGQPALQVSCAAIGGGVTRAYYLNVPVGGGGMWAPAGSAPRSVTLVPLDVAIVTTGGTAVTALTAGHRTAGGWISNPVSATVNLGINEVGTATGTTSAGSTTFISPGQTYTLQASTGAVSVISSDSAHPFSGYGFT